MLNLQKIRQDFPILNTGIVYLDNAASSLTPEYVLQKMLEYYHQYRANVHRGIHHLSQKASEEYERAHTKIADFINARSDSEIIITKNTTEGINLIANGLQLKKGDKIVTTMIEHHSNFIMWLRLRQHLGVNVEIIKPNREGLFNLADFEKAIDDKTKLVAVTHVSNVLGVITPLEGIEKIVHKHGAYLLVDGAQSVPHMKVDVRKLNCDFLAFSGHKMCGPTGSGALYIREELLDEVDPVYIGGGTIENVGKDFYKLTKSPMKFEAGTPPIAEAIGLGAAIEYLETIGMENIAAHERILAKKMREGLAKIKNVEVYGSEPKYGIGIVSFNVGDLNPHDVALALDVSSNIVVRSGHHCALPLMKEVLGRKDGTVRASAYLYNTEEEVEKLISIVSELSRSLT